MFMAYNIATMKTNIADLKNNLSKILAMVSQGLEVEICKRNIPIARIVPQGTQPVKTKQKLAAEEIRSRLLVT